MSPPAEREQLLFLTNLQRLLSEGVFTATYKYALLLSLADIAVEGGDDSGRPLTVCTSHIAEKFVQYYWQQTVPYPARSEELVPEGILRQNTGKTAAVISRIQFARGQYRTFAEIRQDGRAWDRLVAAIDQVVRVMPLWKLQTIGGQTVDFLYANKGSGAAIELKPGVVYCFRLFYPLVQDLVRGAWVRYVREKNQDLLGKATDLGEFLFGSERSELAEVRGVLQDCQQGNCFYCLRPLSGVCHVDHFIPWSLYRVDLGHNFVLAHCSCNLKKRDRLAALEHLDRWVERNRKRRVQLASDFDRRRVPHDLGTSQRVAAWAYTQAATAQGMAWVKADQLIPIDESWVRVLGR
jgi:5-methylcytosine-specific restriction endonuclease McrA